MDSVGSTIEKIKYDELNKERILKEKREFEATRASLIKAIRDTTALTEKSLLQQSELIKSTDKLRKQLLLELIRRNALSDRLNELIRELEDLRMKSNEGISKVWELRSFFCSRIYTAADCYDIWALLKKPAHTVPAICKNNNPLDESILNETECRIKAAIDRRSKTVGERDRLLLEPENGAEFVRIKNALKYSLDKIVDLRH